MGLLRPTKGKVLLHGRDTRGVPAAKLTDDVGYLFQDPDYQIFCNPVFDEVAFGLKIRRVPRREIDEAVEKTLEKCGYQLFWAIVKAILKVHVVGFPYERSRHR